MITNRFDHYNLLMIVQENLNNFSKYGMLLAIYVYYYTLTDTYGTVDVYHLHILIGMLGDKTLFGISEN